MYMANLVAAGYYNDTYGVGRCYRPKDDYGNAPIAPIDMQKSRTKEQREFIINGEKIMATSRKDAKKKYNHRNK